MHVNVKQVNSTIKPCFEIVNLQSLTCKDFRGRGVEKILRDAHSVQMQRILFTN